MIVAGVGFRAAATAEDIVELVRLVAGVNRVKLGRLAAPAFKAKAPALVGAAKLLRLELTLVSEAELAAVQSLCLSRSQAAQAATGFASVAEACALAAAGPGARLLGPRSHHAGATCALAQGGAA
jgi:cobalt-precorrin 5A hydrolase